MKLKKVEISLRFELKQAETDHPQCHIISCVYDIYRRLHTRSPILASKHLHRGRLHIWILDLLCCCA